LLRFPRRWGRALVIVPQLSAKLGCNQAVPGGSCLQRGRPRAKLFVAGPRVRALPKVLPGAFVGAAAFRGLRNITGPLIRCRGSAFSAPFIFIHLGGDRPADDEQNPQALVPSHILGRTVSVGHQTSFDGCSRKGTAWGPVGRSTRASTWTASHRSGRDRSRFGARLRLRASPPGLRLGARAGRWDFH